MDKLWFYAVGGTDKQGPISESELRARLQNGSISASDLVWTDGMASWKSAGEVSELTTVESPSPFASPAPVFAPAATAQPTGSRAALPEGITGWMSFVAIVHIISGVIGSIGCISLVYTIFMILSGAGLYGARNALQNITTVDAALVPFFEKLRFSMKMLGISYIVIAVLVAISFALFGAAIIAAIASASGGLAQ